MPYQKTVKVEVICDKEECPHADLAVGRNQGEANDILKYAKDWSLNPKAGGGFVVKCPTCRRREATRKRMGKGFPKARKVRKDKGGRHNYLKKKGE